MNEKERDQLIRDTFDQCLSGIDTMPSLRPVVNKQLEEGTSKAKKHIPLRRFMVPATALALCVCLIVTGNYLGMLRWPDVIRTPESRLTASPVPLAQPEGKDGEGAASAVDPDTPSPDSQDNIFSRLLENKDPLNAVCEKAGIRFEVHTAEVYDNYTRILCSMQDLEGGRIIVNNLEYYPRFSQDISGPFLSGFIRYGCVEEEYRAWYYLDFWYDGIDDPSDRMVTISAENMPLIPETGEEPEWIRETWSVEIPLKSVMMDQEEHPAKYSEEFFAARLKYTVNDDGTATVVCPGDTYPYLWTRLVIPEKLDGRYVTAIADSAFEGFFKLESVTLPDTVISIGAKAFSGCYNLESADLPYNLESIGDEAFFQANLQTLILPDTLQSIGKDAFGLDYTLKCVVTEGSFAQQYCMENGIDCTAWVTVTGTAPDSTAAAPAADTAEWTDWGTYDPSSVLAPETGSALQEDQYDERMMEIYTPLDQFITAWENKDRDQMMSLCCFELEAGSDAVFRTQETIRALITAMSPQGRSIENAQELVYPEDGSPVTVSVRITDIPRQAKYRFAIRFIRQQDGVWRIDPASLESCEELKYIGMDVIGRLEYEDLLEKAADSETDEPDPGIDMVARFLADMAQEYPELADLQMVPLHIACEDRGVRLEIVSAGYANQMLLLVWTLEDPESRYLGTGTYDEFFGTPAIPDEGWQLLGVNHYACGEKGWFSGLFSYSGTVVPSGGSLPLVLTDLMVRRCKDQNLASLYAEYGGQSGLTDAPENGFFTYDASGRLYPADPEGRKVLDPAHPLAVSLEGTDFLLGGISLAEDGRLHALLYTDSLPLAADVPDENSFFVPVDRFTIMIFYFLEEGTDAYFWQQQEGGRTRTYNEFQVPCTVEYLDRIVLSLFDTERINNTLEVDLPLNLILAGEPG